MTTRDEAAAEDREARPTLEAENNGAAQQPPARGRPSTRRYVAVIAGGLIVALGALTTGLVLVMRSASSSPAAVVGSGARPAPEQQVVTAPPQASLAPDTPPAVMTDHAAGTPEAVFFVRAADQLGDGHSVLVEEATFAQPSGWIVIHTDVGGAPGPIIGVSPLQPPGHHVNVTVALKATVAVSSNLFVMLHTEDNGDTTFDYPAADQPSQLLGQTVMVPCYLQVQK